MSVPVPTIVGEPATLIGVPSGTTSFAVTFCIAGAVASSETRTASHGEPGYAFGELGVSSARSHGSVQRLKTTCAQTPSKVPFARFGGNTESISVAWIVK